MNDLLTILCGDSAAQLRTLEAGSVQLVVTSPPYDNARTYGSAAFEWNFEAVAVELHRVLEDGGTLCWNVGDMVVDGSETLTSFRQALYFKDKCGFLLHDTMIWEKTHVATPCSNRYHQMFEYVFVFTKGKQKTFNAIEDRKNLWAGAEPFSYNSKRQQDGTIIKTRDADGRGSIREYGRRSNVWKGNSAAQETPCATLPHPAMMPKWLARDLILSFSNAGDTVCDPFLGSGTTAIEAIQTGRKAIGIDKNPEYVALARNRCAQATPGFAL